ncbi:MAG: DEAD/DEAH box helicase [Gemmatimonadota bacterium]
MPLTAFHPVIQQWWKTHFEDAQPTAAQTRGWQSIRNGRHTLIAAPTGSGKTLAAFLNSIDELLREGLEKGELPDETRVLYVSPLKALSSDIHKNLAEPRREIRELAEKLGYTTSKITAAVRTGDTPQAERAAMLRKPPHILVTTPESLYLLLTSERSRDMLRTVRTVIVDEIHALVESRRGSHLSLSLERLQHVVDGPLQRIGLSATQRPIEQVANWLVGQRDAHCEIIDEGHIRELDLALELPGSPLEAVMAAEVWQEVYNRIAELISAHRTTIVFVNTRRMAERVAHNLTQRLGGAAITTHHGSLSKEVRLDAEERLKTGKLKALVATASLELGIDIGHVDLVVQIGTPHRIATFLQRVGRSGHTVSGTPKGRMFPLSRDELVECSALLQAVRDGELDRIVMHEQPLDVLAQQIVAETASEEWDETALYDAFRAAWPYRDLTRSDYDDVVRMLAAGYATRRGRRAALIHYDAVNKRIKGRRGARLLALTSGGAIPEVADYRVVSEPEGIFVGTVNEDFAVESLAGDIIQLGNTSWRILRVQSGVVRVADAEGQPPSMPFWIGEAPSRSYELCEAVARLRARVEPHLDDVAQSIAFLKQEYHLSGPAAAQIAVYLGESKRLLGALPTLDTLVLERFFDESGGMQLILHAPFGGRVNRAWGLSLRKKFCQNFNFELQAAATEEGILISLGPQHSFPLDDVFRYVNPATARETLIQAVLDSPIFTTRWRWAAALSLAVPRNRNGKKIAPPLQRMLAEDLLTAAFPDAAACFENIEGEREVPDHPLVNQSLRDCLEEGMDLPRLEEILKRIIAGEIRTVSRDTPEPSPLSHELLNAKVYQFLDDAPLEERRAQAVYTRRALEPTSAGDLGALDSLAIDRVREEAWPDATDASELHDALLTSGFLCVEEADDAWSPLFEELLRAGRAKIVSETYWVATERVPEILAVFPHAVIAPEFRSDVIPGVTDRTWTREDALRELVRGRMDIHGPVTDAEVLGWFNAHTPILSHSHTLSAADVELALIAVESQGVILRGYFIPDQEARQWCERRLLSRIHSYTLNRLRAEIQPVSAADFMRFLFKWLRVDVERQMQGVEGLAGVIELLGGYEAPSAAWESDILPARVKDYTPEQLDMLCLTGRVMWGRISKRSADGKRGGPVKSSPIAIAPRGTLRFADQNGRDTLSSIATQVLEVLEQRGASFFHEIAAAAGVLPTQVEQALAELVARGLATADSYAGLRALLTPAHKRPSLAFDGTPTRRQRRASIYSVESAGRWSALMSSPAADQDVEAVARAVLRRYGVVFRRLLEREVNLPAWRELAMVYRRMEARGEIRGGRFVAGMAGEQFGLPSAVEALRSVRRNRENAEEWVIISAADPLNLVGIITPEERVPALAGNRILFRNGAPVAAMVGGEARAYRSDHGLSDHELALALKRRQVAPQLRAYLRSPDSKERWLKKRTAQPGALD